jgi:hypothetical protein
MAMAFVFRAVASLPTAIVSIPTEHALLSPSEIPFIEAAATDAERPILMESTACEFAKFPTATHVAAPVVACVPIATESSPAHAAVYPSATPLAAKVSDAPPMAIAFA